MSLSYSEGQSAAIPVASMEFAAICLRNSLLLLPEHQQQDVKMENSSKSSSQSGSTESGSENSDACRYDIHTHTTRYSYKYKHMQGEDVTNITTTIYWTVILRFKKKISIVYRKLTLKKKSAGQRQVFVNVNILTMCVVMPMYARHLLCCALTNLICFAVGKVRRPTGYSPRRHRLLSENKKWKTSGNSTCHICTF